MGERSRITICTEEEEKFNEILWKKDKIFVLKKNGLNESRLIIYSGEFQNSYPCI